MKKSEVKVGGVYTAKVTNKLVQVQIEAESRYGGWDGTNLSTGKKVRIRSAAKLRSATGGGTAATGAKKGRSTKKPKEGTGADTAPTLATTGEADAKPVVSGKEAKAETAKKQPKGEKKPKRLSGLDAAALVLEETGEPMNVKQIVDLAEQKGYWKSPGGKTPWATVYSAMIREIAKKGPDARFRKAERGRFVHA